MDRNRCKQLGERLLPEIPAEWRSLPRKPESKPASYAWRAYRFGRRRAKAHLPGPAFDAFIIVVCLLLGLCNLVV